jgi:hypothetical protein
VEGIPTHFYFGHRNHYQPRQCGHSVGHGPASTPPEVVAETDSHLTYSLTNLQPHSDACKLQHVHVHRPVVQWDVYVDDFIGMVQGCAAIMRRVKHALLHSFDKVFRGLSRTDGPFQQ